MKGDNTTRLNQNVLAGFGVAARTLRFFAQGKISETGKLHDVTRFERQAHRIEKASTMSLASRLLTPTSSKRISASSALVRVICGFGSMGAGIFADRPAKTKLEALAQLRRKFGRVGPPRRFPGLACLSRLNSQSVLPLRHQHSRSSAGGTMLHNSARTVLPTWGPP